MRYRILVAIPFLLAAILLGGLWLTDGTAARGPFLRSEVEMVKLLGLIGCLVAALTFHPGDYLRRAWLLSGLCYAVLLLRDFALGAWTPWAPGPRPLGLPVEYIEGALVLIANGGAVAGAWMLSRAWQVAGIELPGTTVGRRTVTTIAIVIALAITGPSMWIDLHRVMGGNLNALVGLASDVGDVFSMCFIAPVLLTAIALRGGLLRWPWALLAASMLGWLFYDAAATFGDLVSAGAMSRQGFVEMFRTFACGFGFGAGLAQRFVVTGKRNS